MLTAIEYCYKYNVALESLHVQHNYSNKYLFSSNKHLYVKETLAIKDLREVLDLHNQTHDYYYFLSEWWSDNHLCKYLTANSNKSYATWYGFITLKLWIPLDERHPIINYKSKKLVECHSLLKYAIWSFMSWNGIFVKLGDRDKLIKKILDTRSH